MRFEKDDFFVEICDATSANIDGPVWHIDTNLKLEDLPIEFRGQFSKTDKEAYEKIKKAVLKWADRNEFKLKS